VLNSSIPPEADPDRDYDIYDDVSFTDELEPYCDTCGWPEDECQCGEGDWPLDDVEANTRGDVA
jgi:hypothetical protein